MSENLLSEATTDNEPEVLTAESDSTEQADNFIASLPDELQESDSLRKFKSNADLAKSYIELERAMGGRIKVPSKDASEEELNEFYSKVTDIPGLVVNPVGSENKDLLYKSLGVPEKADGYQLPEDLALDDEIKRNLFDLGQKAHLTNDQVAALAEAKAEQLSVLNSETEKMRETSQEVLSQKWGSDYENRLNGAKLALSHYKEQYGSLVDQLEAVGAFNNAAFVAMLSEIAPSLQGDGGDLVSGKASYGVTAEDAQMKLQEIRSKPGYFDQSHPDFAALNKHAAKLQRIIQGK